MLGRDMVKSVAPSLMCTSRDRQTESAGVWGRAQDTLEAAAQKESTLGLISTEITALGCRNYIGRGGQAEHKMHCIDPKVSSCTTRPRKTVRLDRLRWPFVASSSRKGQDAAVRQHRAGSCVSGTTVMVPPSGQESPGCHRSVETSIRNHTLARLLLPLFQPPNRARNKIKVITY